MYSELSGVTNMPLFGLQSCVGNYQITNTNVVSNNTPIFTNKDRYYFETITTTLYSVRRI